jgi:hypothetical protein
MDTGQALTRFFQRDSTKANNLTLYPHKEREFWLWLSTWAVFLQKPVRPRLRRRRLRPARLEVVWHEVASTTPPRRSSATARPAVPRRRARRHRRGPGEARHARPPASRRPPSSSPPRPTTTSSSGTTSRTSAARSSGDPRRGRGVRLARPRRAEQRVIDFSDGRSRLLATKPELSGSGCNFQRHCHRAIFVGVGFKFNDFIQAIHRIHRFQQPAPGAHRPHLRRVRARGRPHLHAEVGPAQGADRAHDRVIREHGLNRPVDRRSAHPLDRRRADRGVRRRLAGREQRLRRRDRVDGRPTPST